MKFDYPIIKNWFISSYSPNPYRAPELCPTVIYGNVYGSEKFEDGTFIHTSRIMKYVKEQERIFVKTKNSIYEIRENEMAEEYMVNMPNAWKQIVNWAEESEELNEPT